jgi:hypothetical protein
MTGRRRTNYWFHKLRELNRILGMGINFDRWDEYAGSFQNSPYTDDRVASLKDLEKKKTATQ